MPAADLIATLGRLLQDGALRDALAADPRALLARLGVSECDHLALLQLAPDDLEFQACVLLRKRFDNLRHVLPGTCSRLGQEAWPAFHRYARVSWPSGQDPITLDAHEFCRYLERRHPGRVCDAEWHRVEFARSKKRLALQWLRRANILENPRPALQIFFRAHNGHWREMLIYFSMRPTDRASRRERILPERSENEFRTAES
jgi:hypothetical protein